MVDTSDKLLLELERCFMGRTRRQFTDEFMRESVGLLAGGGRPSSHIADALGIALSRPRAWRNGGTVHAGSPRRSHTQAIPHAGADLAGENVRGAGTNARGWRAKSQKTNAEGGSAWGKETVAIAGELRHSVTPQNIRMPRPLTNAAL